MWGPLNTHHWGFSICICGGHQWTSPMSPLMIWPYRPEQCVQHPEVISQALCSWLAVTTLKFKLTADYIIMWAGFYLRDVTWNWFFMHFLTSLQSAALKWFIHVYREKEGWKNDSGRKTEEMNLRGREDKILFLLFLHNRTHEYMNFYFYSMPERLHDTSPHNLLISDHLLCFFFCFFFSSPFFSPLFPPSSFSLPSTNTFSPVFLPLFCPHQCLQELHKHWVWHWQKLPDSPANSAFIYYQANRHWLKWKHYNLQGSPDSFMHQNQTADSVHSLLWFGLK